VIRSLISSSRDTIGSGLGGPLGREAEPCFPILSLSSRAWRRAASEEPIRERTFGLAAASLLALSAFAGRAADCAPGDPALAGHYYMHGVMEVGSELLLKPDGRFEYMLAYGALDELASGCWTRNGAMVTLHASKFTASMEDPRRFKRLDLTVDPGGKLIRRFDADHVGAYSR
jgi:hypothetical protein